MERTYAQEGLEGLMELAEGRTERSVAPRLAAVPRVFDRAVWRDAALLWLGQRALLVGLAYLAYALLGAGASSPAAPFTLYRVWTRWDAAYYAEIAVHGYTHPVQAAFFPLYAEMERLLSPLTGGDPLLAGLLVSNLACLGAFVALRTLIEREFDRALARRVTLLLAFFPTALFLVAAYAESLFLLLSVTAFLALRERRWLVAGGLIALAALTRPVGVLLLAPLLIEAARALRARRLRARRGRERNGWKRWEPGRMLVASLAPLAALAALYLYFGWRFGSITAALDAERQGWGRGLSAPWDGFALAAGAFVTPGVGAVAWAHGALDIAYTLLFLALALALWGVAPRGWAVYASVTLALALLTPMRKAGFAWAALSSNARFLLVTFPLFVSLARWATRPRATLLLFAGSFALLCVTALAFACGVWVA